MLGLEGLIVEKTHFEDMGTMETAVWCTARALKAA